MRAGENLTRLVAVLALLAALLTIWQHAAWAHGKRAWFERAGVRLLTPGVVLTSRVVAGVSDIGYSLMQAGRLRRENMALRDECSRLNADRVRLAEHFAENRQLRQLVGAPLPPNTHKVAVAQVVGRSPGLMRRRITVKVAAGIELAKDDLLLYGGCLAGRITDAEKSMGEAVLVVDPDHAVAVIDQRSRDEGMLYVETPTEGRGDLLRLDKVVGRCDVAPGDLILTSGLGQVYPKGIPVGSVVAVTSNPAGGQVISALVKPFVDFDRLEFVTIARVQSAP
jgi:rod shape-determining protein MreC